MDQVLLEFSFRDSLGICQKFHQSPAVICEEAQAVPKLREFRWEGCGEGEKIPD